MRTSFTMLLLGCGFAGVLATSAAAQTSGVVFVGDMQSVDRAVLEAADLPLPSVDGRSGLRPPAAVNLPRIDRQVQPASVAPQSAPSRVVPTGFNRAVYNGTAAPRSTDTKAAAPKTSFMGRMKPTWLFGKSDKPKATPKDPFAAATQQARVELTGAATKARAGVRTIPAYVDANTNTATTAGYGRKITAGPKPAKPMSNRGSGIVKRSTTAPRRGLLSGWFKNDSSGAPAGSTPALMKARGSNTGFAMASSSSQAPKVPAAKPPMAPQAIRVANMPRSSQPSPLNKSIPLARAAGPKPVSPMAPKPRALAPRPTVAKAAVPMPRQIDGPQFGEPADVAVFASDESESVIASVREAVMQVPDTMPSTTVSDAAVETATAPMPPKLVPAYVEEAIAPKVPAKPIVAAVAQKPVVAPKPASVMPLPAIEKSIDTYATDVASPSVEPSPVASAFEITDEPYFATDRFERTDAAPTNSSSEPTQRSIDLLAEAHQIAAYAGTAKEFSSVVKHCRYVMAIDESQQAQEYANQLAGWALTKRGDCFDDDGRHDEAEIDYREALRCDAECWRAEHALGVVASRKGNVTEAQRHFDRTIDLNPEFAKAYSNRAALAIHRGDYNRALEDYQTAIEIDPDLSTAHTGRGRVCHMLGMLDEGLRNLDAAEILEPDNALIASGRADLLVDLGRYGQAAEAYGRAIRLDPNSPAPYRNLAWMQATCPIASVRDGEAALANAEQAEQLSGHPDDLTLDTKAAALASLQRFNEASEVQRQAIKIAPPADAAAYAERLAMYEQGQAFTTQPIAVRQASYGSTGGSY